VGRPDPSIAVLFPTYRSLRHLAGAQRVHPAELWLGVDGTTEVPSDAGLTPQACDAAAVADLEAALLRSLRQPDALSFGRLSDLCAALGAADLGPTGTVWRLASTVFEAQRERLLEPDVYLKRLGSQLLSLARAAAGAAVPAARALADEGRLASLTHELWFFVVHAAPVPHGVAAPRTAALREALALRAAASTSVPPAAAPATLLEAVPGLPSPQDLDLSLPEPEEPADAVAPIDDAVKVVGPLRIEIERFNRFLVEADELSRQLGVALGEWSVAADAPLGGHVVAMAQALAVEAAAVGHAQLSSLCAVLARALARSAAFGRFEARDAELFQGSHEEVSRLLHQFAAGFLKPADERRMEALRGFAGDETSLPGLPEMLQPLARQADAARRRLAAALTALREQTADATAGSLDLEALDAVDREAQTLMALFDDLCAHWPASEAVPKA
jgi:hypothetical protein